MVSKYLLVIHDDSAADMLRQWLDARRSPETERWTTRLNRAYSLVIVAPEVRDRVRGRSFSTGVAVSSPQGIVAVGPESLGRGSRAVNSGAALAGSFVRASWTRDELQVEHDLFGSVPLLQAHGPGFVAISDSLLVLTDLRARFGLVNTPDAEVLLARSGLTSRTAQHLSPASIVREIAMVPPARRVVVDCKRPLLVDTVGESFASLAGDADPLEALRSTAGFLVGSLRGLGARDGAVLRISGGRDSGVLLAALARAGTADVPLVVTDAEAEPDAAKALARQVGVEVEVVPSAAGSSSVQAWAASALATSDVIRSTDAPSGPAGGGRLVADGIGAKILRNPWGLQSVSQMSEVATADIRTTDAVASQLRSGLVALGVDPDDQAASRLHYAAYRSGIHGASASAHSGLPFHPLQVLEAVAAVPLRTSATELDPLEALSALLRGDQPSASPTRGARDALSVSELGGPLDDGEVASVSISGSGQDLLRSTVLAIEIAKVRGFTGDERPEGLVETAADVVEVLPEAVREVYEPLVANARWQLLERRVAVHEAGPSLAKLLALTIFTA